ncbi:hypothetical protein [Mangrovicoccus algicola]|uniref:Uncharacterized protein n=1 Tax=Mangrovicoccus algicola TaxID=2771008 RepID=A0A8J7CXF2_9RHOB|nr:hypothetical protein [Mangrovicoccus algicola]MBE3638832.1 hypothetical protein [Mangrovicoccus algicola]
MWEWITENTDTLQVIVSLLTTLVWIVYLHVFLWGYMRQTRSGLLVTRAGAQDAEGRCIVSNMGSEPAFLVDVLAEFTLDGRRSTVSVVDRIELWDRETDPTVGVSAVGPLASGGYVDIGSFSEILSRAGRKTGPEGPPPRPERLRLLAVAATSQARQLVAAQRDFDLVPAERSGRLQVLPVEVEATQIRSRRRRHQLRDLLRELQRQDALDRPATPAR